MIGTAAERAFRHVGVALPTGDDLCAALGGVVVEALAKGQTVVANVTATHGEMLQSRLGRHARSVRWSDTERWAPHPGRRMRAIEDLVEDELRRGAPGVFFIGECPFEAWPAAYRTEWERFDAALNRSLSSFAVDMICCHDESALDPAALEGMRRSHPLLGLEAPLENPDYVAAGPVAGRDPERLGLPASAAVLAGRVLPGEARGFARDVGAALGVADDSTEEIALVLTELVTNAWRARAGEVCVAMWRDSEAVVVQVDDDGAGLRDPLTGYRRPDRDAPGGRGLWLARQLADAVEIAPRDPGTSVRVHFLS